MTFADLIAHLRSLGVTDDDKIESIDYESGVPGEIVVERLKKTGALVIWKDYDGENR